MTHWLLLVCVALIAVGVWWMWPPAGLTVAGVLLAFWLLFREVEDDASP